METAIIPIPAPVLTPYSPALAAAGQAANAYAASAVFEAFIKSKARNTRRAYLDDLATWADFVDDATQGEALYSPSDLAGCPQLWAGTTWGLVEAFKLWMLDSGFAIASINRKISTVRQFALLAEKAGAIAPNEGRLIATVRGYARSAGINIDEQREQSRLGLKKAMWTPISLEQARALKQQPDTPQGRRDTLLMCILLDHGLRAGEVTGLKTTAFDMKARTMTFYRPKVKRDQTLRLSADTLLALAAWFNQDAPAIGALLRGSRKGGILLDPGMSAQKITLRVQQLGLRIGLPNLSAHDCRHYWATNAARSGTDIIQLQEAGGWASLAMPRRYIEINKIPEVKITT